MDYDEDELAQVIAMADGGMPSKALRCDHCDFTCDANEFWIMFRHRQRCKKQRRALLERELRSKIPLDIILLTRTHVLRTHNAYDHIDEGFWLGDETGARGVKQAMPHCVLINCAKEVILASRLQLPLKDSPDQVIQGAIMDAVKLVTSCCDQQVLFFCANGQSRSASVLIGVLMHVRQMSLKNAWKLIKGKRELIAPSASFVAQLIEMERHLFGGSASFPKEALVLID